MNSQTNSWVNEYKKKRPLFKRYTKKLKVLVRELLKKEVIDYHIVSGRTKKISSFRRKISRPGKHYKNPLIQVTDLTGLRIIVHYSDTVDKVSKLIETEFRVDRENSVDKGR